ncbi:hypothetical protein [Parvibacter caecicola]|uniref:hypothetical protein n=1 Tax=Parvibacter caecicola TaxID=747645 RepID=UPI0023F348DD|nr:hypothetical protein [Parvibacter caecicola]
MTSFPRTRAAEQLEARLRAHYAAQRADGRPRGGAIGDEQQLRQLAALMAQERQGAAATPRPMGFAAFVASQVRFVPRWTWIVQAALMALALLLATGAQSAQAVAMGTSLIGGVTALAGLPSLLASKSFNTAELECACYFDCAGATAARLIVIGCSDALVLGCAALCIPLLGALSLLEVLLHLCPPFFAGAAGCLLIARRARPANTLPWALCWTAIVLACAYGFAAVAPVAYEGTSIAVWGCAALAAALWLAREAYLLLDCAARGLDALKATASPVW